MLINYTIKKRTMICRVVGGAEAVDSQSECLENQMLGKCFWVEKWSDHWGVVRLFSLL